MQSLSPSWLGVDPVLASPWRLLLLFGASWLVAKILAWVYSFYEKCARLRCFPQAPKRNWFLGHLGTVGVAGGWVGLGGYLIINRHDEWASGIGGRTAEP